MVLTLDCTDEKANVTINGSIDNKCATSSSLYPVTLVANDSLKFLVALKCFVLKAAVLTRCHLIFNYLVFSLVKQVQKYFSIVNTSLTSKLNRNKKGIFQLVNH